MTSWLLKVDSFLVKINGYNPHLTYFSQKYSGLKVQTKKDDIMMFKKFSERSYMNIYSVEGKEFCHMNVKDL